MLPDDTSARFCPLAAMFPTVRFPSLWPPDTNVTEPPALPVLSMFPRNKFPPDTTVIEPPAPPVLLMFSRDTSSPDIIVIEPPAPPELLMFPRVTFPAEVTTIELLIPPGLLALMLPVWTWPAFIKAVPPETDILFDVNVPPLFTTKLLAVTG